MRNGSTLITPLATKREVIGAGGWVTRFAPPANDGTLMAGTDVGGAVVLAPGGTKWQEQLLAGITVDPSLVDVTYGDMGVYDCAIAPSNSAYRLIFTTGYMFRTTDGGVTYTRSPMPQFPADSGAGGNDADARSVGRCIAIDPANPLRSFLILPTEVRYTNDNWNTYTAISTSTIPARTALTRGVVAFDPSSTVTGGYTQGIYIFIPGSGLYRSTNGGTSWSAVASCPRTTFGSMKINSAGRVFLAGQASNNDQGQLSIYTGSDWATQPNKSCKMVVISPHFANRVYAMGGDSWIDYSADNGATWAIGGTSVGAKPIATSGDIGWHLQTAHVSWSNGDAWFSPLTNRMWVAEGIGCWYVDNPATNPAQGQPFPTNFVGLSNGIEQMVGQTVNFASDGTLGIAQHDRGCMIIPKGPNRTFPSRHGITMDTALHHSQACVPCPTNPNFWVGTALAVLNPPASATGFTADKGATWTMRDALKTASGGPGGGVVAVLSENVWLQAQTNNGKDTGPVRLANHTARNGLWLTKDQGQTWTQVNIGQNIMQPHPVYYLANKSLFTDKYTPNRAWFINCGNPDNPTETGHAESMGLWRIDYNTGTQTATATRVRATFPTQSGLTMGPGYYTPKFRQVDANTFLYCGGRGELGLWRSTDGMATWSLVTGTDNVGAGSGFAEVHGIGVGKPRRGSSTPVLWAIGWRMNTPAGRTSSDNPKHGLWYSEDNGATWTRHSQFPGGLWDFVQDLDADPTEYGRVAIAYTGHGVILIEQNYTLRLS